MFLIEFKPECKKWSYENESGARILSISLIFIQIYWLNSLAYQKLRELYRFNLKEVLADLEVAKTKHQELSEIQLEVSREETIVCLRHEVTKLANLNLKLTSENHILRSCIKLLDVPE